MPKKTVKVTTAMGAGFLIESEVRGHRMLIDQAEGPGATDKGPTPLEYMFLGLAGCIATMGRIVAAQSKIPLRGLRVSVEGDINTDGLLGKATDDRVGFTALRVSVDVDADMTLEEKKAFVEVLDKRCPVSDNLANGSSLSFEVV